MNRGRLRQPGDRSDAVRSGSASRLLALDHAQADALELAESAREHHHHAASFAAELFLGRFRTDLLWPLPRQSDHDRAAGDAMVAAVTPLLAAQLDPEQVDATRTIPPAVIDQLRALGVFRMKIPVEYGGLGFSQVNYNRVIMAIASHCASTAVLVSAHQSIGLPQPLRLFGTDAQKARYFPRLADGALSAFALTEPEVGSDPARMQTTATRTPDGRAYVLDGVKQWTTNGPIADVMVVMARTGEARENGHRRPSISAFIVERSWPGLEVAHRCDFMGLRGIQNGLIRFRSVRVPVENRLGAEGDGLRMALRTLNTGRLTLPAACAGLGKQCLRMARLWGAQRQQWGRAIGTHEAGSAKIADIAATTFAIEAVANVAALWADDGRDVRMEAAMAKLFASEAVWRIVDETLQLRGGRGYERADSLRARGELPWPVERMMRDARINTIIEGTSEIMRLYLAREALDPHLTIAGALLAPGAGGAARLRAACRAAGFYARWYPRQVAGAQLARAHRDMRGWSATARLVDRWASRLALATVHAMARHGPRLPHRQLLLGHLVDAGTELWAMAVTAAWAEHLAATDPDVDQPRVLAEHFVRAAARRVRSHLRAARQDDTRAINAVARDVLAGRYRWLERGIIPVVGKD